MDENRFEPALLNDDLLTVPSTGDIGSYFPLVWRENGLNPLEVGDVGVPTRRESGNTADIRFNAPPAAGAIPEPSAEDKRTWLTSISSLQWDAGPSVGVISEKREDRWLAPSSGGVPGELISEIDEIRCVRDGTALCSESSHG